MSSANAHLALIVATESGVEESYRHISKRVTPLDPLEADGSVLKWYGIYAEDRPIPNELTMLARQRLMKASLDARGMGFVLLHRCGVDFYFLIVCTWRNSNELWETVFYKDGDNMEDFALFPRDGVHKPAFCVWEFVPVWHEQQAWERFLTSERDESAAQVWLHDCFAGLA